MKERHLDFDLSEQARGAQRFFDSLRDLVRRIHGLRRARRRSAWKSGTMSERSRDFAPIRDVGRQSPEAEDVSSGGNSDIKHVRTCDFSVIRMGRIQRSTVRHALDPILFDDFATGWIAPHAMRNAVDLVPATWRFGRAMQGSPLVNQVLRIAWNHSGVGGAVPN